jgi:hypothetical protein
MSKFFLINRISACTLIICTSILADGQILRDTARIRQARECMEDIYDGRFSRAGQICNEIEKELPGSPVPSLIRGMIIYWQNYPLLPTSPERDEYEGLLKSSVSISENASPAKADEAEYILADLCSRGLLLVYYSDNDMTGEVIPMAKGTYHLVRESFNYVSVCSDFRFFTGLYLYYREKYPDIHPVYRPIALLFPHGDIKKGLSDMQNAFEGSVFLNAEAGAMLSWIYAGYEIDIGSSLGVIRKLHVKYPGNPSFLASFIKTLLFAKQYDEAERILQTEGGGISNSFFRAQSMVLQGIIREKKYVDLKGAETFYTNGLDLLKPFGDFGNEYASFACYGLSRVYKADKTGDLKRKFRKEGNRLAEFRHMNFDE